MAYLQVIITDRVFWTCSDTPCPLCFSNCFLFPSSVLWFCTSSFLVLCTAHFSICWIRGPKYDKEPAKDRKLISGRICRRLPSRPIPLLEYWTTVIPLVPRLHKLQNKSWNKANMKTKVTIAKIILHMCEWIDPFWCSKKLSWKGKNLRKRKVEWFPRKVLSRILLEDVKPCSSWSLSLPLFAVFSLPPLDTRETYGNRFSHLVSEANAKLHHSHYAPSVPEVCHVKDVTYCNGLRIETIFLRRISSCYSC